VTAERPLRADARRNRDRLLEAAVRAFSGNADVTLDAIAKDAGVGIGTLYRHFPTREALVEAAYRNELARLCDGATELREHGDPEKALRTWMDQFVEYMTTKREMGDALKRVIASGGDPFEQSRERLVEAMTALLRDGARAGVVRADADPLDVLIALSGVSLALPETGHEGQAGRVLDLIMDGLRVGAGQ
jgi:AcrR family transcriptional regulator